MANIQDPPIQTSPSSSKDSSSSHPTKDPTIRQKLGSNLLTLSDAINNNLIIIRYGTIGSIALLAAYGIANTPLFYRYKSLWDIPENMWRRKWIHGRIVGVLENQNVQIAPSSSSGRGLSSLLSSSLQKDTGNNSQANSGTQQSQALSGELTKPQPVVILFRHSSPIERLLTQGAMDKVLSWTGKSPSRMLYSSSNPHRNLLPIELAGVADPIISVATEGVLSRLADGKTRVSCQLLAQRSTKSSIHTSERIPEEDTGTALCNVTYRKSNQWFSITNLNLELVSSGQAVITSNVVPESDNSSDRLNKKGTDATIITNFSPTSKQLQQDAAFMSELEGAEYAAWKSKTGIWSLESMRELRPEYKEEERYVSNLWSTRFFNMVKIGWGWIRK